MKNIYIEESHFGPKFVLNPICIRYRLPHNYVYWLNSLVSVNSKAQWLLNNRNFYKPGTFINLLRESIDCPLNVVPKITRCKEICVMFTELCETSVLKSYNDLINANYLDIKIPLMLNDNEFPYINLIEEFIHNKQPKKILHIDFTDWVHQDPTLGNKIKEYYRTLIGNNLHVALNSIDPVYQNTPYFIEQWNKIVNIINNTNHLEDIRIEFSFGSLVRDKYMTNSTPSYDNILLWCEKMKKELIVSEFNITYMHSCYYMDQPKSPEIKIAQDRALVCISKKENTFSNIWKSG